MIDPLFWLGLSLLLVAVSLTAVLVAALPALQELSRAARSAEKLFDTLSRELPPTLEAIRLTGIEISDLTDDVGEGVQSAGRVVQQLDQSISGMKRQAKQAQVTTRSLFAGVKAAWRALNRPSPTRRVRETSVSPRDSTPADLSNRLPPPTRPALDLDDYASQLLDPYRHPNYAKDSEASLTDPEDMDEIDEDFDEVIDPYNPSKATHPGKGLED